MPKMNEETRKLIPEDEGFIHIATLVKESEGNRRCGLLVQNELGVYGIFWEGMHHVVWGSPGNPRAVLRRYVGIYKMHLYTDDGAVLRSIDNNLETIL